MSILTEIQNEAQTVWGDLTTLAGKFWAFTKTLFSTLVKDEATALQPYAEQALEEVGADLPILFTGNLSAFAAAIAPVLLATAQKAAAAGIQAGYQALMVAVAAAAANAQAALAAAAQTAVTDAPASNTTGG